MLDVGSERGRRCVVVEEGEEGRRGRGRRKGSGRRCLRSRCCVEGV